MTKSQKNTLAAASLAIVSNDGDNSQPVTVSAPAKGMTPEQRNALRNAQASETLTMFQDIRQQLALAADLAKEGGAKAQEAEGIAAIQAGKLYQAMRSGGASADKVTGLLGDVFGYVPRKDGTDGKTPAGKGADIRKRVQRAVDAANFVAGTDETPFFDGLDPDAKASEGKAKGQSIRTLVERLDYSVEHPDADDGLSIWTVYDRLGDVKRELATRVPFHLDPKRISGLLAAMSNEGAADAIRSNPSLVAAYDAVYEMWGIISAGITVEVDAIAA